MQQAWARRARARQARARRARARARHEQRAWQGRWRSRRERQEEAAQIAHPVNTKRWMDKDGVRINETAWACNKCKVNLCEACFGDFDHARGCLMGQKVAV